jgi:hypothetical protein
MIDKKTIDRFNVKYEQKSGDCWEWKACIAQSGYGDFHYDRKTINSHRMSWLIFKGNIPSGMHVLHRCDNRRCVNPEHLFLGTNADNIKDMFAKKRNPSRRGELSGRAKLCPDDVIEMRKMYYENKLSYGYIASKFNVSKGAARHAVVGINWGHL